MMKFEEVKRHFLLDCNEDHVGLWALVKSVRLDLGITADSEVRRTTLQIVRNFLESGLLQAGFPAEDGMGFVPWPFDVDEAIQRIESEWESLGQDPNIGEIVWFTTTVQGDAKVAGMASEKD